MPLVCCHVVVVCFVFSCRASKKREREENVELFLLTPQKLLLDFVGRSIRCQQMVGNKKERERMLNFFC